MSHRDTDSRTDFQILTVLCLAQSLESSLPTCGLRIIAKDQSNFVLGRMLAEQKRKRNILSSNHVAHWHSLERQCCAGRQQAIGGLGLLISF